MINDNTCEWVENSAAIFRDSENIFNHRTVKHVTIKVRFIQQSVQRKIVVIHYLKTINNIDDIMTKQSAGSRFVQLHDYALGYIDTINIGTAAVAVIWRRIRIRV